MEESDGHESALGVDVPWVEIEVAGWSAMVSFRDVGVYSVGWGFFVSWLVFYWCLLCLLSTYAHSLKVACLKQLLSASLYRRVFACTFVSMCSVREFLVFSVVVSMCSFFPLVF